MKRDEILNIIDRKLLVRKLSLWRLIAIFLFSFIVLNFFVKNILNISKQEFIAEININGFINDDGFRNKKLLEIANNKNIKAVIVNIDSQGGSFVGGERLYNNLRKISEQKPVISVLGNIATSAAYLTALGSDYIIASHGTLTGSVGVLLQSAEFSNLADKLGVKPVVIKSSKYKAVPHFAEKINIEQKGYLQDLINQSNEIFVDIVMTRRAELTETAKKEIKQGKIFIGKRAYELNLIDELGDVESAKLWLKDKNIDTDKIYEVKLNKHNNSIKSLLKGFFNHKVTADLNLLAI